ncbi:hypothetical protein [Sediminimonas sp.]|nr:hypothetical protein [Sediminimonas sp.]
MKTMDRGAAIRIRSASWELDLSRYRAVADARFARFPFESRRTFATEEG